MGRGNGTIIQETCTSRSHSHRQDPGRRHQFEFFKACGLEKPEQLNIQPQAHYDRKETMADANADKHGYNFEADKVDNPFIDGNKVNISLAGDASGSMLDKDIVDYKDSVRQIANLIAGKDDNIGFSAFSYTSNEEMGLASAMLYDKNGIDVESTQYARGGGTPTHEALALQIKHLANSDAEKKIAVVVGDGGSYKPEATKAELEKARQAGIDVVGLALNNNNSGDYNFNNFTQEFGEENTYSIESIEEVPAIVKVLSEQ